MKETIVRADDCLGSSHDACGLGECRLLSQVDHMLESDSLPSVRGVINRRIFLTEKDRSNPTTDEFLPDLVIDVRGESAICMSRIRCEDCVP